MTNFPNTKDNLPKPTGETKMNEAGFEHAELHTKEIEAIEALQNKVGVENDTNTESLDYKVKDLGVKKAGVKTENTFTQNQNFQKVTTNEIEITGDTVQLSEGGTGAKLTAPTEPKIFYNNGTETKFLELGTGLEIDTITDTIKGLTPGLSVQGEFVDKLTSNFKFSKKQQNTFTAFAQIGSSRVGCNGGYNNRAFCSVYQDDYIYLNTFDPATNKMQAKTSVDVGHDGSYCYSKILNYNSDVDIKMVAAARTNNYNSVQVQVFSYNGSNITRDFFYNDTVPVQVDKACDIFRVSATEFKVAFMGYGTQTGFIRTYRVVGNTLTVLGSQDIVLNFGLPGLIKFQEENVVIVQTGNTFKKISLNGATATQVGQDSTLDSNGPYWSVSPGGKIFAVSGSNTADLKTYIFNGAKYVWLSTTTPIGPNSPHEFFFLSEDKAMVASGNSQGVIEFIGQGKEDSIEDLGQNGHLKKMTSYNDSGDHHVRVKNGVNAGVYNFKGNLSNNNKLILSEPVQQTITEKNTLLLPYEKIQASDRSRISWRPDISTGNHYIRIRNKGVN